jgi:protein required for attachment to host cells
MTTSWILVADSGRARIFESDQTFKALAEVDDMVNPSARLKGSELTSDAPGRAFDSGGQGRHAMEDKTSAKEQDELYFAEQINDYLEAGRTAGRFKSLVIIAAPAFLGTLRKTLNNNLANLVAGEINRDLTQHGRQDIIGHLAVLTEK